MKSKFWIFLILLFLPSLEALKLDLLYEKLEEPTPEWILKQIHQDIAPYTTELSRKSLDELFSNNDYCLVRVQVVDGKMTFQKSEWAKIHQVADWIIQLFKVFNTLVRLPDVDFVFSCHDYIQLKGTPLPIFIISKKKHDHGLILYPDWYSLRGFEPDKTLVLEGNVLHPWESKKPLLFFRGSDSGISDWDLWLNYPRPKLMEMSVQHPDLIDAKFNYLFNHHIIGEQARSLGYMGEYVSMRDSSCFKYAMDIDGNCAATPRMPLLMHSTSVILKNTTDSVLWFYPRVKPYEHFIPVSEDLSDLFIKLEWAKNHDAQCQKISANARRLAAEIFNHELIYVYLHRLLVEYAKKQALYYHE
jgi:hypothetical protein